MLKYYFRITSLITVWYRAATTKMRVTDTKRWSNTSNISDQTLWQRRNEIIAELIPPNSSVLDLGAGAQTLREFLAPGCFYQPCDLVKRTEDTILCDFNSGLYPNIQGSFNYVICSGVLEYIRDPEEFLNRASSYGSNLLVSYSPYLSGQSKLRRSAYFGWINHYTKEELESLFKCVQLCWQETAKIKNQTVYKLWKTQ
jgi:hypothetical protein